jgi:hypothetical protein
MAHLAVGNLEAAKQNAADVCAELVAIIADLSKEYPA